MDIHGHIWTYMDIYGHIWTYMDIYGHIWTYMDIYGHTSTYIDIYRHHHGHILYIVITNEFSNNALKYVNITNLISNYYVVLMYLKLYTNNLNLWNSLT